MPDFLVSAATGALSPVLDKLAALLSDEYKRFKGVHGEVKFLIEELETMHAFLLKKSEEENPDAQDKAWMKEVRELSYDIEDSLDDFRVRVDDDSAKPDGFIDKCKNLLAKTKARRRIAKAIQDLKLQVMAVSERHERYKQINNAVMNTSNKTVDRRALAIFEDASRLVGIDQSKQEIISFLTKEDRGISSQQPKVVSIVGIGGIGKTTLANRVYEELNDLFECRVFLSVSRNPDISGILRTILIKVTGQNCYMTDIQQLIMEIKDFLRTKRFFIVIDDVWDVETWEIIKYALSDNSFRSVIITTTRIHGVAKACCSLYSDGWVYKPKPLHEKDSKRLFQNRIFGLGNECPENLKEVSDKILKKCDGLPLAIIAISGLLANKAQNGVHSVMEWNQVQTSIGCGLERDESTVERMMGILSLSYFDLPHHLKACLLYLSLFPEDYKIDKKRLVRLWIAEGFIPAKSTGTLYESGEKSFNELINRNLILPVQKNKWTGEVNTCCLHDTILDFIVCKSTEDNFVTVHANPGLASPLGIKVRRLSLQGKSERDMTLHSNQNNAYVRSIISFGFPCCLLGFRFLRVLDFTGCQRLLENCHLANIGELLQLRYLSLRETWITELPEQIGALQYLETLDLWGCHIIQLPTSIVDLKRLVNLLMGPQKLNCFPSGIKNLQALEELNSVAIDIKYASICVEEIGNLTKMRHLGILLFSSSGFLDKESYVDLLKKMVSSFQRLNMLQTLDVRFDKFEEEAEGHAVILNADDVFFEVPWCSASLRILVFKMSPLSRVPSWMKSLVKIEELELRIKELNEESLCILGDLPVLVNLTLGIVNYLTWGIENYMEHIPSTDKQQVVISNRYGYKSLRYFRVDANPLNSTRSSFIPMLTFEAGSMPKLEELNIDFDADVTISISNGCLDFGLNHLSQLKAVRGSSFGSRLNVYRVRAAFKETLDKHPKLPHFFFYPRHSENQERLRPRRRNKSTVHKTQPNPPSISDLSEQEVVKVLADDVVVSTSGSEDKMSSSTTDANTSQSLTAALPLPTDLSFKIHHHSAPPGLGRRHGQQQHRTKARQRQGATIVRGREMVESAPLILDRVDKRASEAAPTPSDVLGPRLIAAPQQQGAFVPPCFTLGSGSLPNAEPEQHAMDCYKPSQHNDLANAFSNAFNVLFLRNDHPGSSATAVESSSLDTAPSDALGPPLIAGPQQQEAIVPPCFTFSSGSRPNADVDQQAMDCHKPSQRYDLADAFSSAFDGLSLVNDHPGPTGTAVEAASSGTGSSSR